MRLVLTWLCACILLVQINTLRTDPTVERLSYIAQAFFVCTILQMNMLYGDPTEASLVTSSEQTILSMTHVNENVASVNRALV